MQLNWWLQEGDSALILKTLDTASVDALVTDPPAGINFMGKDWDGHKGGRDKWIAWLRDIFAECRRVMKPGAYGWVWALPRTAHWTMTACEDAGFAVRDVLVHVFGTGFPKSRSLLKPASEHWILVKAPGDLRELRIEENRISIAETDLADMIGRSGNSTPNQVYGSRIGQEGIWVPNQSGRWPTNFALSHDDDCKPSGTRKVKAHGSVSSDVPSSPTADVYADRERVAWQAHGNGDGTETVEAWQCVEGCPVKMLDEQSGERGMHSAGAARDGSTAVVSESYSATAYELPKNRNMRRLGDAGGASRFFYVAKPSTKERSAGLPEGARNTHVTVKATTLMQHLISLIAAPSDLILDPFAGSGTTGIAAVKQGCRFVGIEREVEHVEIARQRIAFAVQSV